VYFIVMVLNYTGWEYGGGGGGYNPTVYPIGERSLSSNCTVSGITWTEEFNAIINQWRAESGLPPYKTADKDFYTLYPVDSAHQHAIYQHEYKIFCHEEATFPVGWQTVEDRAERSGYKEYFENGLIGQAGLFHDPLNPGAFINDSRVLNDTTFLTPLAAANLWWNSPGHRSSILRDWGNKDVYSLISWQFSTTPVWIFTIISMLLGYMA
jgi:uncharacterized protein YkwD